MATAQEAQIGINQQYAQVQQARAQSETQLRQLQQLQSQLPEFQSQEALRGKYGGVQGQQKRSVLQRVKDALTGRKGEIKQYQEKLQQYESQTLNPYQQQLQSQAQKNAQELQAFNKAQNFYFRGIPLAVTRGSPEYKYLKALYENENNARRGFYDQIKDLQAQNPDEVIKYDLPNMKITGVESKYFKQSLPTDKYNALVESFNTQPQDIIGTTSYNSQVQELAPPSLFTGGRGVVSMPPSNWQNYKRAVQEKGALSGTLFYGGEKIKSYITERELKQDKPYQPYAQGRLAQFTATTAPYFTPAGPTLLVASGGEKLIFGGSSFEGKPSAISQEIASYKQSGVNPLIASGLAWGLPVAEIALGGFGINSQIKNIRALKAQPETSFLGTLEELQQGGVKADILAKTTRGDQQVYTWGQQLLRRVPETERFWGLGRGVTSTPEGNLKPFLSISGGAERGTGYAVRENPFLKIRGELGRGAIVDKSTGFVYRELGNDIFAYQGGRAVLRINKATGRVSFVVRQPNIEGRLIKVPSQIEGLNDITIIQPSGGPKTPLSKTFGSNQQEVISQFLGDISKVGESSLKPISKTAPRMAPLKVENQPQQSAFWGTGQYERTEGGLLPQGQTDFLDLGNLNKIKAVSFLGSASGLRIDEDLKNLGGLLPKARGLSDTQIKETPSIRQRSYSAQAQDQRLRQPSTLRQRNTTITQPRQTPRPIEPKRPTGGGFYYNPSEKKKRGPRLPLKKKRSLLFIPEIKKGKTFLPLGVFKDPLKADIAAKQKVLSDLSASYRIRTSEGKFILPRTSPRFRLSRNKKTPFTAVQKKRAIPDLRYTGRLTSRKERSLIMMAKKKAPKKPLKIPKPRRPKK